VARARRRGPLAAARRGPAGPALSAGGLGGTDLYASRSRDGAWSPAQNLGAIINSPSADFAPAFSPDGRYLFFTSERPGIAPAPASGRPPGDIYQIDVAVLGI